MNGIKPQSTRSIYQIGSKTNLYILFEHKSKGDKKTLVQMSSYMSAIHSQQSLKKGLQPIIGIVFLQGKGNVPELFSDLYEKNPESEELIEAGFATNFKVQVFQLQRTDLSKLKLKVTTRIWLILMKSIWSRNFRQKFRELAPLLRNLPSEKQLEFFRLCMHYIYRARPKDRETDYFQILEEEHMPKLKEEALTIAERLQKEGREIGVKEGVRAGKLEDARRMKDEGLTSEMILRITGLSQQDLQEAGILD